MTTTNTTNREQDNALCETLSSEILCTDLGDNLNRSISLLEETANKLKTAIIKFDAVPTSWEMKEAPGANEINDLIKESLEMAEEIVARLRVSVF